MSKAAATKGKYIFLWKSFIYIDFFFFFHENAISIFPQGWKFSYVMVYPLHWVESVFLPKQFMDSDFANDINFSRCGLPQRVPVFSLSFLTALSLPFLEQH